jgi:hypothetical protein
MEIAFPIVPFERIAHRGKIKTRTLKTEGCGTQAVTLGQLQKWYAIPVRRRPEEEILRATRPSRTQF